MWRVVREFSNCSGVLGEIFLWDSHQSGEHNGLVLGEFRAAVVEIFGGDLLDMGVRDDFSVHLSEVEKIVRLPGGKLYGLFGDVVYHNDANRCELVEDVEFFVVEAVVEVDLFPLVSFFGALVEIFKAI